MLIKKRARKKTSPIWLWSKSELEKEVGYSQSLSEILKRHGLPSTGGTPAVLKQRLNQDKIDFSHFKLGRHSNLGKRFDFSMSKEEVLATVFIKESKSNAKTARRYCQKYNLIDYHCALCKNPGKWMVGNLVLQMDHMDGNNINHSIENLRWLCPNCHSQTLNYGSKNRK